MQLESVLSRNGLWGVEFGMSPRRVIEVLGDPEGRSLSKPLIFRYGDLQVTFEKQEVWLMSVWNTEDRVRVLSSDIAVNWRIGRDQLSAALASAGLEVAPVRPGEPIEAYGEMFRASAVFSAEGLMDKLSLIGKPY